MWRDRVHALCAVAVCTCCGMFALSWLVDGVHDDDAGGLHRMVGCWEVRCLLLCLSHRSVAHGQLLQAALQCRFSLLLQNCCATACSQHLPCSAEALAQRLLLLLLVGQCVLCKQTQWMAYLLKPAGFVCAASACGCPVMHLQLCQKRIHAAVRHLLCRAFVAAAAPAAML